MTTCCPEVFSPDISNPPPPPPPPLTRNGVADGMNIPTNLRMREDLWWHSDNVVMYRFFRWCRCGRCVLAELLFWFCYDTVGEIWSCLMMKMLLDWVWRAGRMSWSLWEALSGLLWSPRRGLWGSLQVAVGSFLRGTSRNRSGRHGWRRCMRLRRKRISCSSCGHTCPQSSRNSSSATQQKTGTTAGCRYSNCFATRQQGKEAGEERLDKGFISTVLLVTQEPEQTTLLFWSTACSVTPHGLHTADRRWPPVRAIFKSVFSLNILTACLFTYSLFT